MDFSWISWDCFGWICFFFFMPWNLTFKSVLVNFAYQITLCHCYKEKSRFYVDSINNVLIMYVTYNLNHIHDLMNKYKRYIFVYNNDLKYISHVDEIDWLMITNQERTIVYSLFFLRELCIHSCIHVFFFLEKCVFTHVFNVLTFISVEHQYLLLHSFLNQYIDN